MVTHGKGRNFMVFNNLAFFTLFGFFWAWFDFFFSNDVWQPCLSSMERLKASLTAK